ncbi:transposase [Desulfobacter hydrogenophilus]|uniref:transposase n=1 Tax=Desulfobacter hydrogenophilus TaxID=2291 RepID=UPI0031FD3F2B
MMVIPSSNAGRPRKHALQKIINEILYLVHTECQWRDLPDDFPPWSSVYYYFRKFKKNKVWYLAHMKVNIKALIDDVQSYECKECGKYFDDLTGTIFAGHHQPLKMWILCLSFMGLNFSNHQISKELDLNRGDSHNMAAHLRKGVVKESRR